MGRLRMDRPGVRVDTPKLRLESANRDERRRQIEWRKWYGLARWKGRPNGLRWQCLVRDQFTCRICKRVEADSSKLVADHREPHRGDAGLFFDLNNLQCLCETCHATIKQREEMQRGGG